VEAPSLSRTSGAGSLFDSIQRCCSRSVPARVIPLDSLIAPVRVRDEAGGGEGERRY
jgi:hypothetical protein